MIKAFIYDYDGVISDSVNVKTEAFAELYRPFGKDIEDKVVAYHLAHGGVSRFEKFKYYHTQLLNKEIGETEVNELADSFSKLALQKVINAAYIDGAYAFLDKFSGKLLQFICTGTPETEIKIILQQKGLAGFFKEVHGSPRNKKEIVASILKAYELNADEVIFFGDATTDLEAARFHGIRFIGINSDLFGTDVEQYKSFAEMTHVSFT